MCPWLLHAACLWGGFTAALAASGEDKPWARRVYADAVPKVGCNGTAASSNIDEANGTTCLTNMLDGDSCTLTCKEGFLPVGHYFCDASSLLGSPSCELIGAPVQAETRIHGAFKLAAIRHWTIGLGADFRHSVERALVDALVIKLENLHHLEVELRSPAGGRWELASEIFVTYEIVLDDTFWDEEDVKQISNDLRQLGAKSSASHEEFVRAMKGEGYPVVHMEVLTNPSIFEDVIPLSVDLGHVVPSQSSGSANLVWMVLLVSLMVLFSVCCFVPVPCVSKCMETSLDHDVEQPNTEKGQSLDAKLSIKCVVATAHAA